MKKLKASIIKETLQLISDRLGLIMMFALPVALVFIITIIQDAAYRIVNENNISMIISNHDEGDKADQLIQSLGASNMFQITVADFSDEQLKNELLKGDDLIALYLPATFSEELENRAVQMSDRVMLELGVFEAEGEFAQTNPLRLKMYYDPVLQENYCLSISRAITSHLAILENEMMIAAVFDQMEVEVPADMVEQMKGSQTEIERIPAQSGDFAVNPNSTQHNVPAWTLFAMFFMVISLGGNVVRERSTGTFLRLRLLPGSAISILGAKVIVYFVVALLQVILIFSLGKFIFPLIGLPDLYMPNNLLGFILIVVLSSLSAVSFALLIGTITNSQVQANGLGAVLVVIFAAIGGIWVPVFVMPETMQQLAMLSPLYWCLDGFYSLFLKGGDWDALLPVIGVLAIFISCCMALTLLKLKKERLI